MRKKSKKKRMIRGRKAQREENVLKIRPKKYSIEKKKKIKKIMEKRNKE